MCNMAIDDAVLAELREQTVWLRFLALPAVRQGLAQALDTEKKRTVYEASDGHRSSREVGALSGVSHPTVLRWWDEWGSVGLVRSGTAGGRMARLVSLTGLGLRGEAGSKSDRKEAEVD
jgi:hypothetical protein